jgi:hypothetical protein
MKKRWTFINKVDAVSNVPCIRIIQELGISPSPLNTVISNWDTLLKQSVSEESTLKRMTMVKLGEVGMVCMEWYQQKMGSSFTSCACKEMFFCVQECVKITEEGT